MKAKKSMINKIKEEWNEKVGVKTNESPTLIHRDQAMLMFKLIYEELLEYKQVVQDEKISDEEKLVEIADALGDMTYLIFGTVSQFGLQKVFENVMNEIHRSNMTKLVDGKVLKREDGKIIKPKTFESPNLKKVVFDV